MRRGRVVVIGSINQDIVSEVERLPGPGETVLAHASRNNLGGKGSNQAVAAARAGARVQMVARVGAEDETRLRAELRDLGVAAEGVHGVPGLRTGTAYITVAAGENQIVVDPAANSCWDPGLRVDTAIGRPAPRDRDSPLAGASLTETAITPADGDARQSSPGHHAAESELGSVVAEARSSADRVLAVAGSVFEAELLAAADVVVAQLEIPVEVVAWAAGRARRLVLNAAPALEVPREVLERADPLVVNEFELAVIDGGGVATPDEGLRRARELCLGGVPAVVVTLGAAGSVWARRAGDHSVESGYQAAPRVDSVDSTGAGDCYVGALATALAEGQSLEAAVVFATAAAALAVQRIGTHSSYPGRERIAAVVAELLGERESV
ncbi:ribokinase [Nocardia sp. NPDC020380]|uniref:ribokinase n=1 Tax=Nocardia sp. NPDC020380 TaxID=3364309 RepID=UPI0037AA2908